MEEEKKELLEGDTLDNVSGGFYSGEVVNDQIRADHLDNLQWERTTEEAEKVRKHERKMKIIDKVGSLLDTTVQQVGDTHRQAIQTTGTIVGGLLGDIGGKK